MYKIMYDEYTFQHIKLEKQVKTDILMFLTV